MNISNDDMELEGNARYEGYAVELMELIAKEAEKVFNLRLNYRFVPSPNNQYGTYNNNTKEWDGMVREILDKRAELSVAPLTINYDREQAIDFTKPFMTFGISILYIKPQVEPPQLLSFIAPIKLEVWGTIIIAVVIVSVSMYICSRLSPDQWQNPYPCQDDYEYRENPFNISNAFWFSVGSIMQQGCDIMPSAGSTRLVAVAWWLFTLVIIASYTANLAAFLTITTLAETFTSAEELAAQTTIPYGCMVSGNTLEFFKNSEIKTFKTMWENMERTNKFVNSTEEGFQKVRDGSYAFLTESPSLQYKVNTDLNCTLTQVGAELNSLSYGIGVQEGDPLREILSSIILILNDRQVLLELYNKWWKAVDNKCMQAPTKGVFVFLLGGLGVAGVYLFIEVFIYSISRSRQDNVSICRMVSLWFKSSGKGVFPQSLNDGSLDQGSTPITYRSTRSTMANGNDTIANDLRHHPIAEEVEPLNGYSERVHGSTTADTFLSH
ncbi:glutamate receptor ionotropic, kainate 2-like [Watersipora subatra]|uniref:glutamate receptor ionotropic, kainate 2-like n=1 Tax=Watersipora subatra TaxID=2589382 RepID=UPI00355B3D14